MKKHLSFRCVLVLIAAAFAGEQAKADPAVGADQSRGQEMIRKFVEVNRSPALVISFRGRPEMVVAIETNENRVQAIRIVVNPDKLKHLVEPMRLI
jgi:hypothetical protein